MMPWRRNPKPKDQDYPPHIPPFFLCHLREHYNAAGQMFLMGFIGGARVRIVKSDTHVLEGKAGCWSVIVDRSPKYVQTVEPEKLAE